MITRVFKVSVRRFRCGVSGSPWPGHFLPLAKMPGGLAGVFPGRDREPRQESVGTAN